MSYTRIAEPADAEAAVSVLRRSITELCAADHQNDPATLAKWLENKTVENFHSWISSTDNFCIIAELDGHVNGVGIVNRRGEIELCYISPGMQRRGIGTAILTALEARARSWGVRKVYLASTVSARAFYERNGYRPGGTSTCGFGVSRCYPYEKDL